MTGKCLLYSSLLFTCLLNCKSTVKAQQKINADSIRNKMLWFADAKLGIFIHWGMYSVNGVDESWSFDNKKISYEDYNNQMK